MIPNPACIQHCRICTTIGFDSGQIGLRVRRCRSYSISRRKQVQQGLCWISAPHTPHRTVGALEFAAVQVMERQYGDVLQKYNNLHMARDHLNCTVFKITKLQTNSPSLTKRSICVSTKSLSGTTKSVVNHIQFRICQAN